MKNGMIACVSCTIASTPSYRFAVYGSKGIAEITKPTLDNLLFSPAPQSAMVPEGATEMIERPGFDTVREILEAFADSIDGITPFPISHNHMIHGVAAFEAIVRSAASGQVERVL
jgi:predicted dehydrogenase